MGRPDWAPDGVDIDKPSTARIYDYLLGGSHNFAVDREAAHQGLSVMPDLAVQSQGNRAFLYRTVRYLSAIGMRQFLDIGSGIPTAGNVHEVAQRADPEARVVYVDFDPVAVAHGRAMLADNDLATVIQADLRQPATILEHPALRATLDLDQPVALLLVAILHGMPDETDPYGIVRQFRDALVPGSHVVVSHITADHLPEEWEKLVEMSKAADYPLTPRTRAEVERFFTGFDLVEPGLVWLPQWQPEDPADVGDEPERSGYGGVGRKR